MCEATLHPLDKRSHGIRITGLRHHRHAGGGGGTAFDYTCPSAGGGQPSAVRRFFGGEGGVVDRIGVWCTWPLLTRR